MKRYSDRSFVSTIFQGWTDTRSFSYSGPRIHCFSGWRDTRTGASSPFFFQEWTDIRTFSCSGPVLTIFQEWTDTRTFSYSGPRLHYSFHEWTDTWTFSYSGSRLHYFSGMGRYPNRTLLSIIFSGMDRYSDRSLISIIFQERTDIRTFSYSGSRLHYFFRDGQILGQEPRLHTFSGMDRYSDFLVFGAPSLLFFRNGHIPGLSPIRGLVSIIFQEWIDTRAFPYM